MAVVRSTHDISTWAWVAEIDALILARWQEKIKAAFLQSGQGAVHFPIEKDEHDWIYGRLCPKLPMKHVIRRTNPAKLTCDCHEFNCEHVLGLELVVFLTPNQ